MPRFNDHIEQAKKNFRFLSIINQTAPTHFDWQVTTCFYTALHLVNAHLEKGGNMQFRNHSAVKHVISPFSNIAALKMPPEEYACYESLFSLSRRARYLINDKDGHLESADAFFTYDKHLAKSIRHLDKIAQYFTKLYDFDFPEINVKCSHLNQSNIKFFKVT